MLDLSIEKGNLEAAKILLQKGVDPNNKDELGYTPLHKTTDIEMMKLLVGNGENINIKSNGSIFSTFEYAVGKTHNMPSAYSSISIDKRIAIVSFLLDKGATLDIGSNSTIVTYSSLQIAAQAGYEKVVELLLDRGADINRQIKCFNGETVLINVVYGGNVETVKLLLNKGNEKGLNLNPQDIYGNIALYHAISSCNLPIVKLLLENGADKNVRNQDGRRPIEYINKDSSWFRNKIAEGEISQTNYDEIKKLLTSP